jgi:tetratricopeptide (TPR) repeat protein
MRSLLPLALLWALPLLGQTLSPQATRYHELLLKRPQPGLLFDRFYSAWLEDGTPETMLTFLKGRTGTPADLLVLALYHEHQGQEAEALNACAAALEKDPALVDAWMQRARLEARGLDFTAALKSLDAAAALKPAAKVALEVGKLRGRMLLRTGQNEAAVKTWRELAAANPTDEDLAEEVADLLVDEGLYADAATALTQLIASTKDAYAKTMRQMRLGDVHNRAGKKEEALAAYALAFAQAGQDSWIESEALAQIDAVFRKQQNITGLVTHLAKLATEQPQRLALERARARVLAESGEVEAALKLHQDILQRTPGRRDLREAYLDLLESQSKFADAIAQTKLLQEQNPTDKELHIRLAALHQRAKDPAATKAALQAYLKAPGTDESDHLRVARQLEGWEYEAEARAAYEQLVSTYPDSVSAKEAQALFLFRSGDRSAAMTLWRGIAAKGDLDQLIATAQTLMSRQEPATARDVLKAREAEFGKESRFMALLIQTMLAQTDPAAEGKKRTPAEAAKIRVDNAIACLPLVRERLRITTDPSMVEDVLRQAMDVLKSANKQPETLDALLALPTPNLAERALAATLLEAGARPEEAEKLLREAASLGPEAALAAQQRLIRLIEQRQDWTRAAAEAEKLIAMPEGRTSHNVQRLVTLLERSGKPDAALKQIAEWKALSPGAIQPWMDEARLLTTQGRLPDALQLLRTAARKFDSEPAVAAALAEACASAGQLSEAERIYLGLMDKGETAEDKLRWVTALGNAARFRTGLAPLIETFRQRQSTNRADSTPWLALATLYALDSNIPEQERCLQQAARLRPDDLDLVHRIARLQAETGRQPDALRTLQGIVAKDRTNRTKQITASIMIESGDESAGYRLMQEIAGGDKIAPKDAIRLAQSMTVKKDWARLVEFMEPLVRKHPQDYRLLYFLGFSLWQKGDIEPAAAVLTRIPLIGEELPEVAKTSNTSSLAASYYTRQNEIYRRHYPEGYAELMAMISNNNFYPILQLTNTRFSSNRTQALQPPTSLQDAWGNAMCLIIMATQDAEPEVRARIWAAADAAGLAQTDRLAAIRFVSSNTFTGFTTDDEALRLRPEDDVLALYSILKTNLFSTARANAYGDPAPLKRLWERLHGSYPILGGKLAVRAALADEKVGLPLLDQSLVEVEAIAKKNSDVTQNGVVDLYNELLICLGGGQSRKSAAPPVELKPELAHRMIDLLLRSRTQRLFGTRPVFTPAITNACRQQKAWERFMECLVSDLDAMRDPATAQTYSSQITMMSSMLRRGSGAKIIQPMAFPAAPGVPAMLLTYFRQADFYNITNNERCLPEPEEFAPLLPLLDKMPDPHLRIVLAYKAGDKARVERDLTARITGPEPTLDDLFLAASYHSLPNGDAAQAATLLLKLDAQRIPAASRQLLDSALVDAAIAQKEKVSPELRTAAQAAIRRLRLDPAVKTNAALQTQIVDAMTSLGLKDEAAQWQKLAAVTAPPSRSSSYISSSSSSSRKKIQDLLAPGKEDALVAEATSQLRGFLSNYSNGSYYASQARDMMKLITNPKVKERVLAAFQPAVGASLPVRDLHAKLLEMLGDKDKAIAALETLVKDFPDDPEPRLRLAALIATADTKRALSLINEVPLSAYRQFNMGESFLSLFRDRDNIPYDGRLILAEGLLPLLERAEKETNPAAILNAVGWMFELPNTLAQRNYNKPSTPYLYSQDIVNDPESDGIQDKDSAVDPVTSQKRADIHERLCLAMMRLPELADEGFRRHAGVALRDGSIKPDALAAEARQILTAARAAPARRRGADTLTHRMTYSVEQTATWMPSPAEYLLWHAWQAGKGEKITAEVMPLFQGVIHPAQIRVLESLARLWTCPASDFPAAVKAYLSAANASSGDQQHLSTLTDLWKRRALPGITLDEAIIETFRNDRNYSSGNIVPLYLITRTKLVPGPSTDFLDQLAKAMLGGTPDTWAKRAAPTIESRYGSGGSGMSDSQVYTIIEITDSLMRRPETLSAGLHLAARLGLTDSAQWQNNSSYSLIKSATSTGEAALSTLRSLGFFAPAKDLRFTTGRAVPFRLLTELLEDNQLSPRLQLRDLLQKEKSPSLGSRIALALCTPAKDMPAALRAALRTPEVGTDLAALSSQSATSLAAFLKIQLPSLIQDAKTDDALTKTLKPLFAQEFKTQAELADRWLAAQGVGDIDRTESGYREKLIPILVNLIAEDPAKAQKLFEKASDIADTEYTSGRWTPSDNGWSDRSEVMDRLLKATTDLKGIVFCFRLLEQSTSNQLCSDGWSGSNNYNPRLTPIFNKAQGIASPAQGLDALLAACEKELKDTPGTLFALAYYDVLKNMQPPVFRRALAHLTQDKKDSSPLRREMEMAARLVALTEPKVAEDPATQKILAAAGGAEPMWQHYRALLADKNRHARTRLAVAQHLNYWLPHSIDPECARLGAALALTAQKGLYAMTGYTYGHVLDSFTHLPVDAAWKAAAKDHWDAWTARLAAKTNGASYEPCDWAALSMLCLACRAGETEWIQTLMNRFSTRFSDDPGALSILVSTGRHQEAVAHFEKSWATHLYEAGREFYWNAALTAQLPAFRSACKNPELGLLAAVHLSYIRDPAKFFRVGIPNYKDRAARCTPLAREIAAMKFTDPAIRTDAVELLGTLHLLVPAIAAAQDEITPSTDIDAIADHDDTWEQWRQFSPMAGTFSRQIVAGNSAPAIAAYQKALKTTNSNYYLKSTVREIGGRTLWNSLWLAGKQEQPEFRRLLPFIDEILKSTPEDAMDSQYRDALLAKMAIHFLLKEPDTFIQWHKALPKSIGDKIRPKFALNPTSGLWSTLRFLWGDNPKNYPPVEERFKVIYSLLQHPWLSDLCQVRAKAYYLEEELVIKGKLFTFEEFAPLASKFAFILPKEGLQAFWMATRLANHDQIEPALKLFDYAMEQSTQKPVVRPAPGKKILVKAPPTPTWLWTLHLRKAEQAILHQRPAEAQKTLQALLALNPNPSITTEAEALLKLTQ